MHFHCGFFNCTVEQNYFYQDKYYQIETMDAFHSAKIFGYKFRKLSLSSRK